MGNKKRSSKRRKIARSVGDDDDIDESSKRCWSDLPSDLLETIMSKFFFADQINFRAVCKSWHSIDKVPPPLKQMPWLMVFDDIEGKHSWNSCKLVDPTYKKIYTIDMSFINKKKNLSDCEVKIHESKYGWLLMSCVSSKNPTRHSIFLYSPFFVDNNIIELPVLITHYLFAVTFNLNLSKEGEEDLEVIALSLYRESRGIRICRRGDKSWWNKPLLGFSTYCFRSWVHSDGIFYYVDYLRQSGSYDIARNNWTKFSTLVSPSWLSIDDSVMIKFDGEIHLILLNKTNQTWGLMSVYIYKLDLSTGTWEYIDNLGDRALFVGNGYSSILELDEDVEELKDKRQKVYYCYGRLIKHCNALWESRSYACSKDYGSLAQGTHYCRRLWIDPPRRRIGNSLKS